MIDIVPVDGLHRKLIGTVWRNCTRIKIALTLKWACSTEGEPMKKIVVLAVSVALIGVGGCASIGKGKGKAPPPVAAPIVTKG